MIYFLKILLGQLFFLIFFIKDSLIKKKNFFHYNWYYQQTTSSIKSQDCIKKKVFQENCNNYFQSNKLTWNFLRCTLYDHLRICLSKFHRLLVSVPTSGQSFKKTANNPPKRPFLSLIPQMWSRCHFDVRTWTFVSKNDHIGVVFSRLAFVRDSSCHRFLWFIKKFQFSENRNKLPKYVSLIIS